MSDSPNGNRSVLRRSARSVVRLAIALLLAAAVYQVTHRPGSQALLLEGWRNFERGNYQEAERLARQALDANHNQREAILLSARAARAQGRARDALRYCEEMPFDRTQLSIDVDALSGAILLEDLELIGPAQSRLELVVARDPNHLSAREQLVYILSLQARAWELEPHQIELIRRHDVTPSRLIGLGLGRRMYPDISRINRFHDKDREAVAPLLGLAQVAFVQRDVERARDLLLWAARNAPELAEVQVRVGELFFEQESDDEFELWRRLIPELAEIQTHPGYWEVLARWEERQKNDRSAARAYWEALRRDPNRPLANYRLGRLLTALERQSEAAAFLRRAELLEQYIQFLDHQVQSSHPDDVSTNYCRDAAAACRDLGLVWEEFGWAYVAQQGGLSADWIDESLARLGPELESFPSVRTRPSASPADQIDLSEWPSPEFETGARPTVGPAGSDEPDLASTGESHVTFRDCADEAGLDFQYFNDADPQVRGLSRPFEFTGGGAGVLDYDADGWPDVYLPQGARISRVADDVEYIDRLFRNSGGHRFKDRTNAAAVFEPHYSQGCTIGDYNEDGFSDVYVANLGRNQLFENNGDGTFRAVDDSVIAARAEWTTSCLLADLDGDGLPDLYDVNYLAGADVLTRHCRDSTGPLAPCTPRDFEAAQDRVLQNLGDGRFQDVTDTSGVVQPDGKGLGIVAFRVDGDDRLSLFVANDGVRNFLFSPAPDTAGELKFDEEALARGLAFDRQGRAQACMGVAAGDLDGDGHIDLFVTNFTDETNTLYQQQSGTLFEDVTSFTGLDRPSQSMLGFGVQAIDGELDGLPDLLVTNGHIDNYEGRGQMYEMPPQYFRNLGGLRFVEVPSDQLGAFFGRRALGRGMAKLDWNRDGAEDVVISHLESPAALVTNSTRQRGHGLALRLRGTRSSRDAIGTIVCLRHGSRTQVRQLPAGDGYECSNERRMLFGLGSAGGSVSLEVHWPSGLLQVFDQIDADHEWVLVEGRSAAVPWALPNR